MLTLAPQSFNVQPVDGTFKKGEFSPPLSWTRSHMGEVLQAKQVQATDQEVIALLRPAIPDA